MPTRRGGGAEAALKDVIRDFRRDQIVEVARRLFGERGTTDIPIDEIAAQAGVARSTVYVYFANRDELLRACLEGLHTQLLDAIADAWDDSTDPGERLERLFEAMLARVDENQAFFRLAMVAQSSEAVGAELSLIGLNVARLIMDVYNDGVEAGQFRKDDPDWVTRFVGLVIFGAMSVRAGETDPEDRAVEAAALRRYVLDGLGA